MSDEKNIDDFRSRHDAAARFGNARVESSLRVGARRPCCGDGRSEVSNLVKRLREFAKDYDCSPEQTYEWQAADRIKRQEAFIAKIRHQVMGREKDVAFRYFVSEALRALDKEAE